MWLVAIAAGVSLVACGGTGNVRTDTDVGNAPAQDARAYEARPIAASVPAIGGGAWQPILVDGSPPWLAIEHRVSGSEVCYALRAVNHLTFDAVEELSAEPWPVLPNEPGFAAAEEPAACVSDELLANDGIVGLSFDFTDDGTALLLGEVDRGSVLQEVTASSPVQVLTQGEVFLVIGADPSVRLTTFTLDHQGESRTCVSPDFELGDVTMTCDEWNIGADGSS